jgi:hypothetical protein
MESLQQYNLEVNWWKEIHGNSLAQGDYLEGCPIPIIPDEFDPITGVDVEFTIEKHNIIILSQSCDLANEKVKSVVVCPIYTLQEIQAVLSSHYSKPTSWEPVRRGQVEGWHMISGFSGSRDNTKSLIVDFKQVHSLPIGFLKKFAGNFEARARLISPYVERLSQSFARFFMRVGLSYEISPFK